MKSVFSKNYKGSQEIIKDIVLHFDSRGKHFDERNRNSLKLFDVDGKIINVKSFKKPNLINKIAYGTFRSSKAARSFEYAHKLLEKNILTPEPIAYFEEETFLFGRSFYVSEHLEYDLTYRELIEDSDYVGNVDILSAFAKFTHTLHHKGIHFLDHSPGNTLIKITPNGYDFYLVDLNRMNFGKMDFKTRMRNFERLSKVKDHVAMMAKAYAIESGEEEVNVFKAMWEAVQKFQAGFARKQKRKKALKFWK